MTKFLYVNFNIGRKASVLLFEKLGMIPGRYATKGCSNMNQKRFSYAEYKNRPTSGNKRKVIREQITSKEDDDIDKEGTLYDP